MHLSPKGWMLALWLLLSVALLQAQSVQPDSTAIPVSTKVDGTVCTEECCYNDLTPVGIMYTHVHPKGQWMFSYRYMHMAMNGMSDGTDKVSNDEIFNQYIMSSGNMQMQMHMLMAMYGISDRFTAMLMLNYNVNSMDMVMLPGFTHYHGGTGPSASNKIRTHGFGDTKLSLTYGLLNGVHHRISLIGGLSIPTGSIEESGDHGEMYEGERLPYSMQNGSGTWDLQPGVNYSFRSGSFNYGAQLLSTVRTGYNYLDYKLGNDVTFNNWLAYQWTNCIASSVRVEGYSASAIHGKDDDLYTWYEPASNPANYGGQKLSTYLGLTYCFKNGTLKNNKAGVEFGIPVYQNLNGPQMKTTSSLFASWVMVF